MPPRRQQPRSVQVTDLQALHARMVQKSTDYRNTATAYRSKCHEGMKVGLIQKAAVVDMLAGWLEEVIHANAPPMVQVAEPAQETSRPSPAEAKPEDQDEGQVDVPGLREDNGPA